MQLFQAERASDGELAFAHSAAYVAGIDSGTLPPVVYREIGFPWSDAMADRARRSVGATLSAARSALTHVVAANLAGGTHHAYADRGGGFCVFNDFAVTARVMQAEWGRRARPGARQLQVAIIDLDVHQGNGTAHILRNDDSIFTMSMHGEKNFPFRKELSDLEIALPDGCRDDRYMEALDHALLELEGRFAPGLVLYLAGADVHEGDRLGRLKLTDDGMQARARLVLDWCWQRRIPCAIAMGGGYGRDLNDTVRVQLNTYSIALEYWRKWQVL